MNLEVPLATFVQQYLLYNVCSTRQVLVLYNPAAVRQFDGKSVSCTRHYIEALVEAEVSDFDRQDRCSSQWIVASGGSMASGNRRRSRCTMWRSSMQQGPLSHLFRGSLFYMYGYADMLLVRIKVH